MRFVERDMPMEFIESVKNAGGEPLKAMVYCRGNDTVVMLLSRDPSGPNGEIENHVSVSASTSGLRRVPLMGEIRGSAIAGGFDWSQCDIVPGENFVASPLMPDSILARRGDVRSRWCGYHRLHLFTGLVSSWTRTGVSTIMTQCMEC